MEENLFCEEGSIMQEVGCFGIFFVTGYACLESFPHAPVTAKDFIIGGDAGRGSCGCVVVSASGDVSMSGCRDSGCCFFSVSAKYAIMAASGIFVIGEQSL